MNRMLRMIGWAKTKDFRLLYSIIANDQDFLEVLPDGALVRFGLANDSAAMNSRINFAPRVAVWPPSN